MKDKILELKEQTLDMNTDWLSFSDHSYCLASAEWADVVSGCNYVIDRYDDFTCLASEEVSVEEDGADFNKVKGDVENER